MNGVKFESGTWNKTQDISLKAEWTIKTYEIKYNIVTETKTYNITKELKYGEEYTFYQSNLAGKEFLGWYLNGVKIPETGKWTYDFDSPIVLEDKWMNSNYEINYYVDGQLYETKTYHYGDVTTKVTNPTKSNHVFIGWSYDVEGFVTNGIMPAQNIQANATWLRVTNEINSYTGSTRKITDSDGYYDTIYPDMNREFLKSLGYTKLSVVIKFDCYEVNDGYQDVWVYSCNDELLKHVEYDTGGTGFFSGYKKWVTYEFSLSIGLDKVQTDSSFYIEWGANGDVGDDEWKLRNLKVTIIALKD